MVRLRLFLLDPTTASENVHFSPLFDIFRVTVMFGMMNMAVNMANNTHVYSKMLWKKEVWLNAWKIENEEWGYTVGFFADTFYLKSVLSDVRQHLIWWEISNRHPEYIHMCENIVAMICRASALKSDSIEFKGSFLSVRACSNCDTFHEEDIEHIILQCVKHDEMRKNLSTVINEFDEINNTSVGQSQDKLLYILGKDIDGVSDDVKLSFWLKIGQIINGMYEQSILDRSGVG